jgi:CheY-like chemotaxis protein
MDIPTLIVDDQEDIRFLLRLLIERANEGLGVIAEAASGSEALEQVERHDPLVVILDMMMPEMNGLEAAAHIRAKRPAQLMILCTAYLDESLVERAKAAGLNDCLSKDDMRDLPELIRKVVRGATTAGSSV